MSEKSKNLAVGVVVAILAILLASLVISQPANDDRVQQIGASIKCPVCQGESIADSPASMAVDMMGLVEQRVDEGATNEEIIDELMGSFTGAVLLDPPVSGATLLLWIVPLLALILGVVAIAWWKTHPPEESGGDVPTPEHRSNRRLVGGLIVIGGLAIIIGVATLLIQDGTGATSGAAETGAEILAGNLDDVSNETMEAVIAANLDNAEIDGMRLALAERYFELGDYRSGFPHFLAVAQSPIATDDQATIALVRLGWMAYDGNGEVDTATELLDQALEISPDSPVALYVKGQVLWCGAGDTATASALFEEILTQVELPEDTRSRVQADLNLAGTGAACT